MFFLGHTYAKQKQFLQDSIDKCSSKSILKMFVILALMSPALNLLSKLCHGCLKLTWECTWELHSSHRCFHAPNLTVIIPMNKHCDNCIII